LLSQTVNQIIIFRLEDTRNCVFGGLGALYARLRERVLMEADPCSLLSGQTVSIKFFPLFRRNNLIFGIIKFRIIR